MNNIYQTVEETIYYAKKHLDLSEDDETYFRNILLGELHLDKPFEGEINTSFIDGLKTPDYLVNQIKDYLLQELHLDEPSADRFIVKLMGLITPLPSQVQHQFECLEEKSDFDALSYLYNLSISNYYIQKTKVDQNILWKAEDGNKYLEISINLSKPEKSPKDIQKALIKPAVSTYPKCVLCPENVGSYGSDSLPARENIRLIKMKLDHDNWYLQYSPYGYYHMHCIVLHELHENMSIDNHTIIALLDFVDRFPSFFLGSNAELPIVGGSILNHRHFQGGEHLLPVMTAPILKDVPLSKEFPHTTLSLVDWYNTVLLIKGKERGEVIHLYEKILSSWRSFNDPTTGLVSESDGHIHNTINPIVRKVNGEYLVYIILRNNQTSIEYPDGVYHAHPEYFAIKKENIGLIEAMGLFILPARLVRQFKEIKEVIEQKIPDEEAFKKFPDLVIFSPMITSLRNSKDVDKDTTLYVNDVCRHILDNTAVFKKNEAGFAGLNRFLGFFR